MKALASDFDGTIYFEDGFKKENTQAIQKLQKEGYLFGVCTGRPLLGVTHHETSEFTYDFYIVSSGASVLDKNFNIIYENCVSKEIIQQIYEQFKEETKVAVQANFKIYSYDQPVEIDIDQIIIHHVDEIDGNRIYGLSLNTRDENHARLIRQQILDEFGDEIDAFQNKEYIDIVGKGCSKGVGIVKLKEAYGLEEVYGIGDSYNDLPMLETVDHSFTFTDSPDIVKEKADDVVDSMAEAIDIILKKA